MATHQSKLNSCIHSVWLRGQKLHATAGALSFLRWGFLLFIIGMLLDWQTFMPTPGRVVIFAIVFGVALYKAWQSGWKEVKAFSARNTALQIEDRLGGCDSLLVTAVQFSAAGAPCMGSQAMIELTCQKAEAEAQKVMPSSVVTAERLKKPMLHVLILTVVLALIGVISIDFLGAGAKRLLPPWQSVKYPTRTVITLETEDLVVKEGDQTAILAEVTGVLPKNAEIRVRPTVGKSFKRKVPIADGKMTYEITSAYRSFEYRIFAGDDRTDWQKVTVIAAPRIDKAEVTLTYPEYTKKGTETVDALTLNVPEGTKIKWVLHLDRPVTEASMIGTAGPASELTISNDGMVATLDTVVVEKEIQVVDPNAAKADPDTEKADPETEKADPEMDKVDPKAEKVEPKAKKTKKGKRGKKAEEAKKAAEAAKEAADAAEAAKKAEEAKKAVPLITKIIQVNVPYKATKSQAYSFSWTEKSQGYSFKSPNNYLQVQPDEAPQVELTKPEKNIFATLGRDVTLAYRARDDHGIGEAMIGYEVNKVKEKSVSITPPTLDQTGEVLIDWDYRETLKDLAVGDTVTFIIEMADRYPGKDGPHKVRSQARRLSILSKRDYLIRMDRQRVRLLTQVKNIYREERGIHYLVKDFDPTADNFIQTCQVEVVRQELIKERLLEIKQQMTELVDDLAANGFTEPLYTAELTRLQGELQRIADEHVKLVSQALKALAIASTNHPETADTTKAVDAVNVAARELGVMVLQLGFKEATEVMAREIQTVAEDQAYLRWRVIDEGSAESAAHGDLAKRQNELADWLLRLLESIPADRESKEDDALVAFKLSRLRKDLTKDLTASTMRKASVSMGKAKPEAIADMQMDAVKALLKAEFRLRRGLEYAALVKANRLFTEQAAAQKELREAIAEMTAAEFKARQADVKRVQKVLSKRLALLLMPAMPAPRCKLLDAVQPPKPKVAGWLAESVRAQDAISNAIEASDRDKTMAELVEAEKVFHALADIVNERIGQFAEAQRVSATAAAAGSQISKIGMLTERLSSIIEKTGDAQADGAESEYVIPLLNRLAQDLIIFKNGIVKHNDRIKNSPESIAPIVAYLEGAAADLRQSATSIKNKTLDEAIALQEKVEMTFEEIVVLLTTQVEDVGSFSTALSSNRAASEPGPLMEDIQSEQYDMVKLMKTTKDDDLPKLAMAQKNLIHAVNAVLTYLDPFAHHIETGSVMLFAKEDMDAAAIGLKAKDREEALDAGSFVAESIQKIIDQIKALAPQYTYSMELVEFVHEGLSARIVIQALQKQLAAKCAATKTKVELAKLAEFQEELLKRSRKTSELLVSVTGMTILSEGMSGMEDALKRLKAGDAVGAAEQMTQVVNTLEGSNATLLRLNTLIPLVLEPCLDPVVPPEFSFLVDFTGLATSHKMLYRTTNLASVKDLAALGAEQAKLSKRCDLFANRYATLSQQLIAKELGAIKASYTRGRPPKTPIAEATGAMEKKMTVFFNQSTAQLAVAKSLMEGASAKLSGGAVKEAIAAQRDAAAQLRMFYLNNILMFIKEPGPPPDAPPAPSFDISTEDDFMLTSPGSVTGKKVKGGRLEWQVLGRRDRAALNENFARELPLEYRGILKDYYERLAK